MSRAEQEDLRRRGMNRSIRPWPRRRNTEAYAVDLAPESLDLTRLADRIRAQLTSQRANRGTMSDIADRLSAIGTSEPTFQDPSLALHAEDWCRIEGWGLVRRVRQHDGAYTYEHSTPPGGPGETESDAFLDDFLLPPPAVHAPPPHTLPQEQHVRELTEALARLSRARDQPPTTVDRTERSLRELADTEPWYTISVGGITSLPTPTETTPIDTIPFGNTQRPVSTLHLLVCEFIDERDAKEHAPGHGVPAEFLCPLSHLAMRNPVGCADGHTYDKPMLVRAFRSSRNNNMGKVISPMTRDVLAHPGQTMMYPCLPMISLMERWVKERVTVEEGETIESTLKARMPCAEAEQETLIV